MGAFISFEDVSYKYPSRQRETGATAGNQAIDHVSVKIYPGEFVACIGANGSGKSTFARLADALLLPDMGVVKVSGYDTRQKENRPIIHSQVGFVFQFPEDQIVSTTVEEDVAFGPQNLALPPAVIRERVEKALQEVGLWEDRHRSPHLLSAGQTQRLALAGVLAMNPQCVIFDEASTMIDPSGRKALMEAMHRLHRQGTLVLFITHFMEEAARAERVLIFERGKLVEDSPPAQVFSAPDRLEKLGLDLPPAARVARGLAQVLPGFPRGAYRMEDLLTALPGYPGGGMDQPLSFQASAFPSNSTIIDVERLGYTYMRGTPIEQRALENVTITVPAGQTRGLMGMTGSGKSTLMQHLNGLLRPQEGRVRVDQFHLNDLSLDRRAVVRKVGLVFQNPEAQFFEYYVGDEIAFGPRQLKMAAPGDPRLAGYVRTAMEKVGLDFERFKDRPLSGLSGGERRKVALASTLALQPSILLLDEPTAGLDPRSRRDLLDRLGEMHDLGITILLSSHRMSDIARLTQAVTVMDKGSVGLDGPTTDIFSNREALLKYGLDLPVVTQAAGGLREKGWPIPAGILVIDTLIKMLREALSKEHGMPQNNHHSEASG